jgi:hypothetical protein
MSVALLVALFLSRAEDLCVFRLVCREWRAAADEAAWTVVLPAAFCARFLDGSRSVFDAMPHLCRLRNLRALDVSLCPPVARLPLALELRDALSPWHAEARAPVVHGRPVGWDDRAELGSAERRQRSVRLQAGLLDTWTIAHPEAKDWVASFLLLVTELSVRHDGLPCCETAVAGLLARRRPVCFYVCTRPAWRLLTPAFAQSFETLLGACSDAAPPLRGGVLWGAALWPAAGTLLPSEPEVALLQAFAAGASRADGWTARATAALARMRACEELFLATDACLDGQRKARDAMADLDAVLDALPAGLRPRAVRVSLVKLNNKAQREALRARPGALLRAMALCGSEFVLEVSARGERSVFEALMDCAAFLAFGDRRPSSLSVEVHADVASAPPEDERHSQLFGATACAVRLVRYENQELYG